MTTARENLLRIFRHETPEWIPLTGHVDPYNQPNREGMDPELAAALGTVQWCDESTVRFSRYLGLDIADYRGAPVRVTRRAVTVESREDGPDTIQTWHTPAGDLRQVRRRCREDGTSYLMEHLVKTPDDLPRLAAVFEDETLAIDPPAVEIIRKRKELIGNDGILMCFTHGTPMGMMYREYSGVEALAYLYADAPGALGDLFRVMERNYLRQFELSTQSGLDVLVTMDDTSTNTISPTMFEQFNMDCTDRRADVCHRAGKLYFHHSCGLIHDLLSIYRRTRMDAVHAFTVPPVGNVTIAQGRPLLGNRITIFASVGAMADEQWDPVGVRASIRQLYADAAPGDHFILGLAAFPHRTMAQTQFVADVCREYRTLRAG